VNEQKRLNEYQPYSVSVEIDSNGVIRVSIHAKDKFDVNRFRKTLAELLGVIFELREDIAKFESTFFNLIKQKYEEERQSIPEVISAINFNDIFMGDFPNISFNPKYRSLSKKLSKPEILAAILIVYGPHSASELAEALSNVVGEKIKSNQVSMYLTSRKSWLQKCVKRTDKKYLIFDGAKQWIIEKLSKKIKTE